MIYSSQCAKKGIALLLTVMFVIVITVAIGVGLKEVNSATKVIKDENLMYQSSIILEDVINILQNSPDIAQVADSNSSDELYLLISSTSFIPFSIGDAEIVLKVQSARAKMHTSQLDENTTDLFIDYLNNNSINSQYLELLFDNKEGIKEDNSYISGIFDDNPYLFRDYIASKRHLEKINDFYAQEYNENGLEKINFENLFYFSKENNNTAVDLNYATVEVWELLLGCTKERAEMMHENGGAYDGYESLNLNDDELVRLKKFKPKFFQPIILVEIEIKQNGGVSNMQFEYNIKQKKGSNFVYEI